MRDGAGRQTTDIPLADTRADTTHVTLPPTRTAQAVTGESALERQSRVNLARGRLEAARPQVDKFQKNALEQDPDKKTYGRACANSARNVIGCHFVFY